MRTRTLLLVIIPSIALAQAVDRIQEDGVDLPRRSTLNFTGGGVTCSRVASTIECNVPTGGGGGGAPTTVDYLVKTASGDLSAERVVTDTSSVTWDWATAGQAKANVVTPVATATALAADPADCSAGQYATTIAASGALTCAQPSFSQLSSTASIAQGGTTETASTEDAVLVGAGTTDWAPKVLPSCSNGTTEKLLYNSTTNAFSCGTDQAGSGGGYDTVIDESTPLTQRTDIIFTGDGVTASDNGSETVIEIDDIAALATDLDCTSCINPATELGATVAVGQGGTGQTTQTAAFDALAPTTTQGDIIFHNGTDNVRLAKGTGLQQLRMNAGATAPEWFTASAGSDPWTVLKKTDADQTTTAATITLTSITSLTFSMTASTDYLLECTILYSGNTATNGIGLTIDLSGTVTLISVGVQINGIAADSAATVWEGVITADVDPVLGSGVAAINTVYTAHLSGVIRNDGSADNATVQFRNEVSAASNTVTAKTGSSCRYRTF
jgi:hypothetical protein